MTSALLLVDLQNDFLPGGALEVKNGNEILKVINDILKFPFDYVIASKDWHPKDHQSFAETHGKSPYEKINLKEIEQILWPVHCVQGTYGAEFSKEWDFQKVTSTFYKGIDKQMDSYSAFYDNGHQKSTGLGEYLIKMKVQKLFCAGLATDYCVKYSVLDATKFDLQIFVIKDGCKAVNLNKGDEEESLKLIEQAGAKIILSKDIPIYL